MQVIQPIPKEEWDVVVVGAGVAGLAAAVSALDLGAKTLVLEKAPNLKNTNTYRAGGFVMFERGIEARTSMSLTAPVEEKIEEAIKASEGKCDPQVIRLLWENMDGSMSWLTQHGFAWWGEGTGKATVTIPTGRALQSMGAGAGFNNQLREITEEMGGKIVFGVKVKGLLLNAKGRVVGVRTLTPEGLIDYGARGGVVLATSGFQGNQEMLIKYMGANIAYGFRLTGSPYSTGEGHLMAQQVGAKLSFMDQFETRTVDKTWRPGSPGQVGPIRALGGIYFSCVFVNKLGKRFMDESLASHDEIAGSIVVQPDSVATFVFDENVRMIAPDEVARYERTRPGIIIRADTIEELATKIATPPGQLRQTIDEYNKAIDNGTAASLDVPKSGYQVKIETPPFCAVYPVWCGLNATVGGPLVNSKALVLDQEGDPIPGLYAAGEMVGGSFYAKYITTPGGAIYRKSAVEYVPWGIAMGVILGRIAGANAGTLE